MENYNPFSLEGKHILVTGASSGIGRAIAIECSKLGARVTVSARNEERLAETLSCMAGSGHTIIAADLTDPKDMDALCAATGNMDGLCNCAGIMEMRILKFCDEAYIKKIMGTNFETPALLTRNLLKAKKINKSGSIVFISSTSGVVTSGPANSVYAASKSALYGFSKTVAVEYAPQKIRSNIICPAMVETPMINIGSLTAELLDVDRKRYPLGRYGRPEEIAHAAAYFLSDASAWVTGTAFVIDGGLTVV